MVFYQWCKGVPSVPTCRHIIFGFPLVHVYVLECTFYVYVLEYSEYLGMNTFGFFWFVAYSYSGTGYWSTK
jgi:hypothetical protein